MRCSGKSKTSLQCDEAGQCMWPLSYPTGPTGKSWCTVCSRLPPAERRSKYR